MKTPGGEIKALGNFKVTSGKLRVSDPCYGEGIWCSGDFKARMGWWTSAVLIGDGGDRWGRRVFALAVAAPHVDVDRLFEMAEVDGALEDSGIDVGVDSGQCGIFDVRAKLDVADDLEHQSIVDAHIDRKFMERLLDPDNNYFYAACCARTSGEAGAGIMPAGVVASSGYGDGSYRCLLRMDGDEAIGAVVVFIKHPNTQEEEG